jgi:hypothetical protein
VVPVSRTADLEPPVCEFCGDFILDEDQVCPARDDGGTCHP